VFDRDVDSAILIKFYYLRFYLYGFGYSFQISVLSGRNMIERINITSGPTIAIGIFVVPLLNESQKFASSGNKNPKR
jgi:hypothetical protein